MLEGSLPGMKKESGNGNFLYFHVLAVGLEVPLNNSKSLWKEHSERIFPYLRGQVCLNVKTEREGR